MIYDFPPSIAEATFRGFLFGLAFAAVIAILIATRRRKQERDQAKEMGEHVRGSHGR